jgi:hypothetical protein
VLTGRGGIALADGDVLDVETAGSARGSHRLLRE